jgi:hypothetical protein
MREFLSPQYWRETLIKNLKSNPSVYFNWKATQPITITLEAQKREEPGLPALPHPALPLR